MPSLCSPTKSAATESNKTNKRGKEMDATGLQQFWMTFDGNEYKNTYASVYCPFTQLHEVSEFKSKNVCQQLFNSRQEEEEEREMQETNHINNSRAKNFYQSVEEDIIASSLTDHIAHAYLQQSPLASSSAQSTGNYQING